jgi:hypothetical protein
MDSLYRQLTNSLVDSVQQEIVRVSRVEEKVKVIDSKFDQLRVENAVRESMLDPCVY